MRAIEFVTEVFQSGKENWRWRRREETEAIAEFKVGDRKYSWQALSHIQDFEPEKWEISFRLLREPSDPSDLDLHGLTKTGNSAEVMSYAVEITREFLKFYGAGVQQLTFSAKQDERNSRISLYANMIKRLLPNWHLSKDYDPHIGVIFNLTKPEIN